MRKYKIAVDSSANLYNDEYISSIPLSLTLGDKLFIDDDNIDVPSFLKDMEEYKGKTTSACPSGGLWQEAFEGNDEIYCIALTSKLSGCYNALNIAKDTYLEEHPNVKIKTFDSSTTGPELELFTEKIKEEIEQGKSFEEISEDLEEYKKHTNLGFMLKSLENFAKNGRVNIAMAKIVKLLHIAIVGCASDDGDLKPLNKCRGEKHGITQIFKNMIASSYVGGKVRIAHTDNLKGALMLQDLIKEQFPNADITIKENKALCAYYTERYGLLVGYESN